MNHNKRLLIMALTSDFPPANLPVAGGGNWECAEEIELEAAEALAGLAHSAESATGFRGGRKDRLLVKIESPPGDSGELGAKAEVSVCRLSDPAEYPAVAQPQSENTCLMTEKVKVEQAAELPKSSLMCTNNCTPVTRSKSRQKLTEEEKETRRIRRVLANRESARQTIRRRQALCEELTRKASSLALENENLTRVKELAVEEYNSLKCTNESLKAQMARKMKTEAEAAQVNSEPTSAQTSTSPTTHYPFFPYKNLFTPILLPSLIQSSNPVQSQNGSQNEAAMQAVPMPNSFRELESPLNITCQGTPVYILPCPWFVPPDHMSGLQFHPSFDLNDDQNRTSMNNCCGPSASASSSAKPVTQAETCRPSLPVEVKTETSSSTETIPKNLHKVPFGFPPDGGGQKSGVHPDGMGITSTTLNLVKPAPTVKHETCSIQPFSSTVGHSVNAVSESIGCSSRKQVGRDVAAEARKRRREITKLKSLHCRQLQMHF